MDEMPMAATGKEGLRWDEMILRHNILLGKSENVYQ